jgi:drug/metabolite transporter (DMT)-like permease
MSYAFLGEAVTAPDLAGFGLVISGLAIALKRCERLAN